LEKTFSMRSRAEILRGDVRDAKILLQKQGKFILISAVLAPYSTYYSPHNFVMSAAPSIISPIGDRHDPPTHFGK
jgi:hypothetical protein